MVHPAVHAGQRHENRNRDGDRPADGGHPHAANARREYQGEPTVDGQRGGGVAGREARVRRQVLEAVDLRPVAMDDPRRRAVGRRLHGDRSDEEGRDPPALEAGEDHSDYADDDGYDDTTRDDRADERPLGPGRVPVCGEPADKALVSARDPAASEHDLGQEQPERDRERGEEQVAEDRCDQEDRDRVAARERLGEALSRPALGRLERRDVGNCGVPGPNDTGSARHSRSAIYDSERGFGHGPRLPDS
jgi:hypothetical protein